MSSAVRTKSVALWTCLAMASTVPLCPRVCHESLASARSSYRQAMKSLTLMLATMNVDRIRIVMDRSGVVRMDVVRSVSSRS